MQCARKRRRSATPPESLSSDDGHEAFTCDCKSPKDTTWKVILCGRCLCSQHLACWIRTEELQDYARALCNRCQYDALDTIVRARRTQIEEAAEMLERKRREMDDLYGRILWQHYCVLPFENPNLPQALIAMTATTLRNGRTVPLHPAPESWLNEILSNVHAMLDEAGKEIVAAYSEGADSYDREIDRVLRPWRDIAVWLVHHGPWKGKRGNLGVLGEVLGLVEKGPFWRRWLEELPVETEEAEGDMMQSIEGPVEHPSVRLEVSTQGRKDESSKVTQSQDIGMHGGGGDGSKWGEVHGRVVKTFANEIGRFEIWQPDKGAKEEKNA